ncbi:MAG: N-acetylmuramoyl-L-alanine amidase [Oscillospiraceae bacterium]|nr:N-acetylmuramoyl-L-alanine amidase [Oscillospiraceae bacterium]
MRKKALLFISAAVLIAAVVLVVFLTTKRGDGARRGVIKPDGSSLTLIIDAGHGGEDGGAVSPSGLVESVVNLDVARRIELLAAFFGVTTVMTREREDIDYSDSAETTRERKTEDQRARLKIINNTPNAVFLSIHQNIFADESPFGAEALYAPTEGSRELALGLQELFVSSLDPENRRSAALIQDTIYLMNNISCPAVLVECAFLSNPKEEALLRTDEYKLKLATVITAGYLQNRDELSGIYGLEVSA